MALTVNRPLNIIRVFAYMADASTASSAWAVAPCRGKIVEVGSILYAAITTANDAITVEINGTAVTGAAFTITQSGSAAGDVDSAVPTALNNVVKGDKIEFVNDGASDTTAPVMFYADILVN
jgi:hypothetical protein